MATELKWTKAQAKDFWKEISLLIIEPGTKANLSKRPTGYKGKVLSKELGKALLEWGVERIAEMQDKLYAFNEYGLLICLQAMDAAGKDGAIKHIMSGLNPQGVKVTAFKQPSSEELDHDFLWRHYKALPPRGEVGIFNRSHYENVLVSRVHPEYVLNENLPHINSEADIKESFWNHRYKQIRRFESIVHDSGTKIIKFFLHVSKEEQRQRLIARIDDKQKNWKFSLSDLNERGLWKGYMHVYEEMLTATSSKEAPWYVIPADDKWYSRIAIASVIYQHMEQLHLKYPTVSEEQLKKLQEARKQLVAEMATPSKKAK